MIYRDSLWFLALDGYHFPPGAFHRNLVFVWDGGFSYSVARLLAVLRSIF